MTGPERNIDLNILIKVSEQGIRDALQPDFGPWPFFSESMKKVPRKKRQSHQQIKESVEFPLIRQALWVSEDRKSQARC
jgi:hypothetical protein